MTVEIIGLGLIGTSVSLAVRRAWPDARVIELDRGDGLGNLSPAGIIVLATPVDATVEILRTHARHFGDAAIVDTGSTKRVILAAARDAGLRHCVGGHPMAGAATSGPDGARADLFDHRAWFLIPAFSGTPTLERVRAFVEALGAAPVVMDDDGSTHDRVMAAVSHLPQVVASALMAVVGDAAGDPGLHWAGNGLRDTTRLAGSPASMWQGILSTNASELRPLLLALADSLRETADRLDDPQAIRHLFETANRHRARLDAR